MVDPIWAGQYKFLQPLWAGKERIVFDPQLNAMMLAPGGIKLPWDKAGQAQALVAELLEQGPGALWRLVPDLHEVAKAGVDPTRFGARALHDGPLLALRRSWDVAMVDVTGLVDSMLAQGELLAPEASLVDALLSSLTSQRHLFLWTRALGKEPSRCKRWRALTRLLQTRNGPAPQAMAVGATPTMQVMPLDPLQAGDLATFVDRQLGGQAADHWSYLAYLGPEPKLAARCFELPAPAFEPSPATLPKRSRTPLKQRLLEAQAALEESERARVALLQDLDRAGAQIASLHEQVDALRDCAEPTKAAPGQSATLLAADEASSHALLLHASWEIERLKGQLGALRARPVSELESENAQLRAKVGLHAVAAPKGLSIPTETQEPSPPKKNSEPNDPPEVQETPAQTQRQGPWNSELSRAQLSLAQTTHALPSAWKGELTAIASSLKHLRARVERGELAPLPLQSKLHELERGVERLVRGSEAQDAGPASPERIG